MLLLLLLSQVVNGAARPPCSIQAVREEVGAVHRRWGGRVCVCKRERSERERRWIGVRLEPLSVSVCVSSPPDPCDAAGVKQQR